MIPRSGPLALNLRTGVAGVAFRDLRLMATCPLDLEGIAIA